MVELSQLYGDLRAQDVSLYIRDLGFSEAACIEYHHKYAVFLDSACFQSLRRMKSILAHEIGHCATGCTHRVSSPLDLVESSLSGRRCSTIQARRRSASRGRAPSGFFTPRPPRRFSAKKAEFCSYVNKSFALFSPEKGGGIPVKRGKTGRISGKSFF